ncbi:glutamate racemase [Flavobacterium sp. MAH-1]|uniref:Glutamate racemase n=1 Tax=Flavobacterium agri TaxID=2743471 RepID=A0A7Y9C5V1_9FLAO|nr:glutamate racemase [Flavobacterium agri]NUY81632.1 glutamate racemase [Flavobacterium agri]NYA71656.1 glutamate racemase [Flavobacterium agri]
MHNNHPIGVFDSGIGGTSIWKEIHSLLPNEDTIYLADSKNAPYGQRPKEEIVALSEKNVEFLLERNCKLIVVACNTATTNAIKELRAKYNVPFVGIEPAIKPAALDSKTNVIGVLATKGTLSSELFHKAVETYQNTKIIEQVGYNLVSLIENGQMESDEMTRLLHEYLNPMIQANIDYLVLGCSHYPYLIPQIRQIVPDHVQIIDSGRAVARQTQHLLKEVAGIAEPRIGKTEFYTNSDPAVLSQILGNEYKVAVLDF